MHAAFFVLLAASLARFLLRHPWADLGGWVVALSGALAVLYVLEPALLEPRAARRRLVWLAAVVAVWTVLVVLAPSFALCAVPLLYTGLRTLRPRAALVLVAVLAVFVVAALQKLADGGVDPVLLAAPPAVAAIATAVFVHAQRQADRQRALIGDLIRTRRELAATERREGTLAERQRLSMEIHDTLAQGLSSQRMLLQAAERTWDGDPATARRHVRTAASIAEHNLAEARRFVHDLAPADLASGGDLAQALAALAARETAPGLEVRFHAEDAGHAGDAEGAEGAAGTSAPLPDPVASALLRIAQGALANVREHAGATRAALTLTRLDDQVVLDVADDGRGFAPEAARGRRASGGGRGHGLPAMRARLAHLGGTLTVESAPGEGTVLSAAIPLNPQDPQDPHAPQDPHDPQDPLDPRPHQERRR
ncbi:sensor histidine kinase [Streptomyces sp. TRM64462]|uniref:sensor histidine kinase n=1 Tax=Streptomyces sp. TRM64462 TaxID=2741726 RepID=UPI001586605B|nr:sensor histidine kinase [Streptomyces sp. TRM64462]